jgi:tetratricopeptide (TPR) repeat protein
MKRITFYHILGVSSDATADEIAAAFRKKVKLWHPDVSHHPDAEERMREINKAAEILCDPERRLRYDRALAGKAPFESATVPAQGAYDESVLHKFGSAALHLIGLQKEGVRFALGGMAALLILGGIILIALLAIPLFSEPFSLQEANAGKAQALTAASHEDISPVLQAGDAQLEAGDYAGALAAYNAVISENPGTAGRDLWYNRGIALNSLGLYGEAAASFDHALQIAPDDPAALAQKGAALIGLGRYDEALHYTDLALSGESNTAWIWNTRGLALAGLGQQKEASLAFENARVFGTGRDTVLYRNVVVPRGIVTGF